MLLIAYIKQGYSVARSLSVPPRRELCSCLASKVSTSKFNITAHILHFISSNYTYPL